MVWRLVRKQVPAAQPLFLRKTIIISISNRIRFGKIIKNCWPYYKLAACWSFPHRNLVKQCAGLFFRLLPGKANRLQKNRLELFKRVAALMGVIIENKQAEQKINISNERYMLATKATNDAIWDYDIKNKQLYWGENFYSIFGYESIGPSSKNGFLGK